MRISRLPRLSFKCRLLHKMIRELNQDRKGFKVELMSAFDLTTACLKLLFKKKKNTAEWKLHMIEASVSVTLHLICSQMIIQLSGCLPDHLILLPSEWCPQGWYHIWTASFSYLCCIQYSRNSSNSFGQFARSTEVPLSSLDSFGFALGTETIHTVIWTQIPSWSPDLLTNTSCSASNWQSSRDWLSACADPLQVRLENNILPIPFHWLIITQQCLWWVW